MRDVGLPSATEEGYLTYTRPREIRIMIARALVRMRNGIGWRFGRGRRVSRIFKFNNGWDLARLHDNTYAQ